VGLVLGNHGLARGAPLKIVKFKVKDGNFQEGYSLSNSRYENFALFIFHFALKEGFYGTDRSSF
jgi:hypothetical protein